MDLHWPWPWLGHAHKRTSWNIIQVWTLGRFCLRFFFFLLFSTAQTQENKNCYWNSEAWQPEWWVKFTIVTILAHILYESQSLWLKWHMRILMHPAEKISRLEAPPPPPPAPRLCEWREIPGLGGDHRIYFGLIGTVCGVVTIFDNQPQRSQSQYEDRNLGSLQERQTPETSESDVDSMFSTFVPVVGVLSSFSVRNLTGWNELKWKWGVSRIPRMFLSGKRLQKMLDFWEFPAEMFRLWSSAQSRCRSARRSEEKHQGFLQHKFKHDDTKMDDEDTKTAGHIHLEDAWSPSHTVTLNLPHLWNVQ